MQKKKKGLLGVYPDNFAHIVQFDENQNFNNIEFPTINMV